MIVTRMPDRGASLTRMLRERGAQPILVPVQEAEPVDGGERQELLDLLDAAAAGPRDREPLWLVITSANTVRALALLSRQERGRRLAELLAAALEGGLRVAAVGPATAAELAEHGLPVHLRPHRASSAAGLLDTWARPERSGPGKGPGTVLLPQSAAASPRLSRGLGELGWRVEQRVAYRMAAWPADDPLVSAPPAEQDIVWTLSRARRELAAGSIGAAVLTAPSAARALARGAVADLRPVALAAIGRPTQAAVVELGLEAVVADSTDPPGLIEALEESAVRAARPGPPGSSTSEHTTQAAQEDLS